MTGTLRTAGARRGFLASILGTALGFIAQKSNAQTIKKESPPVRIGRRIVTGTDDQGRSRVASEEPVPTSSTWRNDRAEGLVFWVARELPVPMAGQIEPTSDYQPANRAPARGLDGRLFTWAAGHSYPRHATPTLDFIIILSGRLELVLDAESRVLEPGDVVVQRGTQHAWRVVGTEPCTFAGIILDARAGG